MPRLVWSRQARLDLSRLHAFLAPKSGDAAYRAVRTLQQALKMLRKHPEIGRPVADFPPGYREWIIEFGQSAYVALYLYDEKQVTLLAIRHGREVGY